LTQAGQNRVDALRRYEILDTFPEASFERLTRLVANIFSTPIALISLLDEHRQWFKSHYGQENSETSIDLSFCRHAIEGDGVMVVPDATLDTRFRENALVTGEPNIRFYAGAPLSTPEGTKIGTLCIIDSLPRRSLVNSEKQILKDLAAVVIDEMELRLALLRAKRGNGVHP
jgi:GAF domain-containing protein